MKVLKILVVSAIGTFAVLSLARCASESGGSSTAKPRSNPVTASSESSASQPAPVSEPVSDSGRTPEQNLAIIDNGGPVKAGAEKPYAILLDAAEPKCTENRESLADLTAKVVEVTTKEGVRTNNLDVLMGVSKVLAEYDRPQACQEIFTALALIMVGSKQ